MGIWDFAKSAGAKIGLGDGPGDSEAEEKAAAAKVELDKARAASKERRAKRSSQTAKERKAMTAKDHEEAVDAARQARERQANVKRFQALQKSRGLEKLVTDLGITINDLDVRFHQGLATITGSAPDQATRERAILAIGNVEGVESVIDEIEIGTAGVDSATHVVASGDTLWAIAEKQYGDGNKYTAIFEANKPMLSDPDKIYPGQVLRIPID